MKGKMAAALRLIAAFFTVVILAGCGSGETVESVTEAVPHTGASVEGTVFTYDGTEYEMTDRCALISTLEIYDTVGEDYMILAGHISPKVSYYGVFNNKTRTFEKDIQGTQLTYYGKDIHTIVYAVWNEIISYDDVLVAAVDLQEPEYISGLSYAEDGKALTVTIRKEERERKETAVLATEQVSTSQ